MKNKIFPLLAAGIFACSFVLNAAEPPKIGDKAPDFTLKTLDGQSVMLSNLTASNNTVLIVLRGWPGYQCPICERQVHDYITSASGFADSKTRVIMVYPGPADDLKAHAQEFLGNKDWPKDFVYVIDPDYSMVNAYGLRWDAPKETAYPSTFVLDRKGIVHWEQISHSHGERSKASDILNELKQLPE
ncbi:MAG TPA: peroxiredoxin family protein [Candidatus Baltobacteraceae bacterium]|nr:peroxiredoxin family protein [Candidatus Baltobacteraceae bacterium]